MWAGLAVEHFDGHKNAVFEFQYDALLCWVKTVKDTLAWITDKGDFVCCGDDGDVDVHVVILRITASFFGISFIRW